MSERQPRYGGNNGNSFGGINDRPNRGEPSLSFVNADDLFTVTSKQEHRGTKVRKYKKEDVQESPAPPS